MSARRPKNDMTSGNTSSPHAFTVHQKPVRFVNTDGAPPNKRRRVNVACQTCRKRKIRCDGRKPYCIKCEENGHKCLGYASSCSSKQQDVRDERVTDNIHESSSSHSRASHGTVATDACAVQDNFHLSTLILPTISDMISTSETLHDVSADHQTEVPYTPQVERLQVSSNASRRVPYFRYFGPTAIAPGYKQMVVSMNQSTGRSTSHCPVPLSSTSPDKYIEDSFATNILHMDVHVYDPSSNSDTSPLILHLIEMFFVHMGGNFPFLKKETFSSEIKSKKVEAILVNAVCSLAARFSNHPLLSQPDLHDNTLRLECGAVFAQRAKAAIIDTFPCPTMVSTQVCLLLAYESFGAGQDSALWMYLGCAIRMVIDTGLHKISYAQFEDSHTKQTSACNSHQQRKSFDTLSEDAISSKLMEQERIDTFWAVFVLDRVVSTGVGRPVTLKEKDFELPLPRIVDRTSSQWPPPYLALLQIISMYGHISDAINAVRCADVMESASISMVEQNLTSFYHNLDQRLVFNATNFQHYVRTGDGTNFILLHFWFHTLIILIHQPALLQTSCNNSLSLSPHSRELSMSSAKTIADILQFAELIDPRSVLSNPFICQPLYISARAFLAEPALHADQSLSSGDRSHGSEYRNRSDAEQRDTIHVEGTGASQSAQHHNYAKCHRGLQRIQSYWSGAKYIVTALEQRANGIWDPETYTADEMESTRLPIFEVPTEWKRKMASSTSPRSKRVADPEHARRFDIHQNQAIGWSLTGTTNSPTSNLTFLYPSLVPNGSSSGGEPPSGNMIYDPIRPAQSTRTARVTSSIAPIYPNSNEIDLAFCFDRNLAEQPQQSFDQSEYASSAGTFMDPNISTSHFTTADLASGYIYAAGQQTRASNETNLSGVQDMLLDSQDIDISTLAHEASWLRYVPTYGWNASTSEHTPGPAWIDDMTSDT